MQKLDPVRIVVEAVEIFIRENCDLIIIVDISGCHWHEAVLLEEMQALSQVQSGIDSKT